MTSRRTGRRVVNTHWRRKNKKQSGARQKAAGKREAMRPKERQQFIQFVACGSIFVLLVAVKLLLPEKMTAFQEKLESAMEQNVDVQAVFSAVGRAFSGEEDAAQEVYQAVFHPEEAVVQKAAVILPENTMALELLQAYRKDAGESRETTELTQSEETASETLDLAYVLYSEENLPENVSLEQSILGFDYCTPVSGTLSSKFGYRDHPTEGEERFHYGVDLAADTGTEIACFADGVVTAVGESSSYGKYCMVSHDGGYKTLYAHCSRITVSSGTEIEEGETIAQVGETGMATGPHLHFELQREGIYLNPIYYLTGV